MFFEKNGNLYFINNKKIYDIKIDKGIIKKSKSNEKYDDETLYTLYEIKCRYNALFLEEEVEVEVEEESDEEVQEDSKEEELQNDETSEEK